MAEDDHNLDHEQYIEKWQQKLAIDQNALDREVEMQPYLFFQVADECAEALSRRDSAYDELKRTDADLNFSVRESLAESGQRVTEEMVKSAVLIDNRHIEAQKKYNEAKLESDKIEALKSAFQQRGYMLRDLVQLFATGYSMGSSVNYPPHSSRDVAAEKNRQALKSGLQRGEGD